jgi:uncharacterized protein (TIGR03086 family)
VKDEQWHSPSPCTDWDAAEVVDHLIEGNQNFAALVTGQPPAPAAGQAGDRAQSYIASAAALKSAYSTPEALQRICESLHGPVPGAAIVQLRTAEQLIHGWDLARATEQDARLPGDLAEEALAVYQAQLDGADRDHLPFDAPQPVAGDAPAIDRLAAFFGRRP